MSTQINDERNALAGRIVVVLNSIALNSFTTAYQAEINAPMLNYLHLLWIEIIPFQLSVQNLNTYLNHIRSHNLFVIDLVDNCC